MVLVKMGLQRLEQELALRPLQRRLLLRRRAHLRLVWKSGCVPQNKQGGTKRLHRLAIRAPQIAVSLTTCTHGLIITRRARLENPVRYHSRHPQTRWQERAILTKTCTPVRPITA